MTTTKETKNTTSKKLLLTTIIAAVVASVIMTGILVVYPAISSAVYAVQPNNTTTTPTVSENGKLPKITGSINVMQTTKNIIKDSLKVPFSRAADIAGKQITNGTVIEGHLGVVQGYLVYTFFGVNSVTQTVYHTIIDAGNGKVLYASPGQQMGGPGFFGTPGAFGPIGSLGPHGLAGGFGHGPFGFGFGFGPWKAPGGFMGGGGPWH